MNQPYECHITLSCNSKEEATRLQDFLLYETVKGWDYSCIHGDPYFGDFILHYATAHYSDQSLAILETQSMVALLQQNEFIVMRSKVEHVIYDVRY